MTYGIGLVVPVVSTALLLTGCSASNPGGPNAQAEAQAPVALKATAGFYALDPTHASLRWSLNHMGLSQYTASFDDVQAEVTLDPADLAKSSVLLTINPKSVNAYFPDAMYKAGHGDSGFASWSEEIANGPMYLNAGCPSSEHLAQLAA